MPWKQKEKKKSESKRTTHSAKFKSQFEEATSHAAGLAQQFSGELDTPQENKALSSNKITDPIPKRAVHTHNPVSHQSTETATVKSKDDTSKVESVPSSKQSIGSNKDPIGTDVQEKEKAALEDIVKN
mmetsp:Transcript_14569/g.20781  ORF Transcript_14569/g.20781 Transcript_14569/m.20781 type:complete len:128 (-) Transcript_14569:513-896(-)|eukprot:CAMPEP_0184864452 /NCGR_PEP_ID=MMETSP0580-20130426/15000_1 /TAXON_ID=1118495 /ORGANISM="Dactyliosolen fragilissimus" /LENGTH=127 /DNA_ID=CAMNT_0027363247 /DNA_START=42 /DNA_END=425 /DNA_ORIENTATION=-